MFVCATCNCSCIIFMPVICETHVTIKLFSIICLLNTLLLMIKYKLLNYADDVVLLMEGSTEDGSVIHI